MLIHVGRVIQKTLMIFVLSLIMFYTITNTVVGNNNVLDPNIHQFVINDGEEELYPDFIEVGKGDTVIWYNQGTYPVRIKFLTALGIVCSPIIHYDSDADGIFTSDQIPQGGFASLCLINEGMYDFEVIRVNNAGQQVQHVNSMQGKVLVE